MAGREILLDIKGLCLNFYTRDEVVRALDGVDLTIFKGETLGLVGESGCGKTATASSIMRLVPSPPGKIESGRIMFFPSGRPVEGPESDKFNDAEATRGELYALKGKDIEERSEEPDCCDLLQMTGEELRAVRGNTISMIFQEPMSSLNPVLTSGKQISEVMLLHEPAELAVAALKRMDAEENALRKGRQGTKLQDGHGDPTCSECQTSVDANEGFCLECGSTFGRRSLSIVRFKNSICRRYLKKLINDPCSFSLYAAGRLPFLRAYKRQLENEAMDRAIALLKLVRVPDPVNAARSYPFELSGGMQQRVMIAMALACDPQLLIADEPTTALDVTVQAQILKLMRDLQTEMGTTILLITHNLGVVAEICDRVGVMYAGTMAEICPTDELFREPLHPYAQGLLGAIPRPDRDLSRLETIEGAVPNLANPPAGCRFHPRCPHAMPVCSQERPSMTEVRPDHFVACHLHGGGRS